MLRVTEIIDLCGLVNFEFVSTYALDRGTSVHKATALDDKGKLEPLSVHPIVAPYLESWRKFRTFHALVIKAIEFPVEHPPLQYRGTLDRVVVFRDWAAEVLLDLKNGSPQPWHPLQTAGYAMAYALMTKGPTPKRGSVHLQSDGSIAKLILHKDLSDFDVWKGLVTTAHFKVTHGIRNNVSAATRSA